MGGLQKDFDEQGFVKVEQLFSVSEALSFKADIRRVLEAERARAVGAGQPPESVLRDGVFVGIAAHSPLFHAVARDPRLLDVLEQILGPNIEFLSDKIVFKTATTNYGSPWHQDWPYWKGTHKISAWIALDTATPEHGCLRMMPGSHRQEAVHDGAALAGEGFSLRLQPNAVDEADAVTVPAEPGDVIFFHDLTLHASFPNTSGQDRWALISTYRSASEPDLQYEWAVAAAIVRGAG